MKRTSAEAFSAERPTQSDGEETGSSDNESGEEEALNDALRGTLQGFAPPDSAADQDPNKLVDKPFDKVCSALVEALNVLKTTRIPLDAYDKAEIAMVSPDFMTKYPGLQDLLTIQGHYLASEARTRKNGMQILCSAATFELGSKSNVQLSLEHNHVAQALVAIMKLPYSLVCKNQGSNKKRLDDNTIDEVRDIKWDMCSMIFRLRYGADIEIDDNDKLFFDNTFADVVVNKCYESLVHLQYYCWVMRRAYEMFTLGRNKDFLIDLVTSITKGNAYSKRCHTSGGRLKNSTILTSDSELALAGCRRLIYERISGKTVHSRKRLPAMTAMEHEIYYHPSSVAPQPSTYHPTYFTG